MGAALFCFIVTLSSAISWCRASVIEQRFTDMHCTQQGIEAVPVVIPTNTCLQENPKSFIVDCDQIQNSVIIKAYDNGLCEGTASIQTVQLKTCFRGWDDYALYSNCTQSSSVMFTVQYIVALFILPLISS